MPFECNWQRYAHFAIIFHVWETVKQSVSKTRPVTWMGAVNEFRQTRVRFRAYCKQVFDASCYACVIAPTLEHFCESRVYKNARIKDRGVLTAAETSAVLAARHILSYNPAAGMLEDHETRESLLYSVYKTHNAAENNGLLQLLEWHQAVEAFAASH